MHPTASPILEFTVRDEATSLEHRVQVRLYSSGVGIHLPGQADAEERYVAFDVYGGEARVFIRGDDGETSDDPHVLIDGLTSER